MHKLLDIMPYTEQAKFVFDKIITSGKFVVKYDPDVDGMFSGLFMEQFIKEKYHLNVPVSVNDNRGHGPIDLKMLPSSQSGTKELLDIPKDYGIINVDSSISEEMLNKLVADGHDILSLDHHELEYKQDVNNSEERVIFTQVNNSIGMVLNNQYWCMKPEYQFQSGSGVVLSFLEAISPGFATDARIAMNGITLLSDTRPIEGNIARSILSTLYTYSPDAISSDPTIKHITETIGFNKYSLGPNSLDRVYIDFMLSPFINALLRFNKGYETIKWLNGGSLRMQQPRQMQQDVIKEMREQVSILDLNNIAIVTLTKDEFLPYDQSNFIGYFANRVVNEYGKTTAIAIFDDKTDAPSELLDSKNSKKFIRGSVRGLRSSVDYRTAFSKMGMIALGHKGAFGLKSMQTQKSFWTQADKYIGLLEQTTKEEFSIVTIDNIKQQRDLLHRIATDNQYKRGPNKTYIKYTGNMVQTQKRSAKLVEYLVDGLLVKTFDVDLTPTTEHVYIDPTIDKGYLKLYLVKLVS